MRDKAELISNISCLQEKMIQLVQGYKVDTWMKLDLTIDQLKSLILIYSRGKISFKDLAKALGISRSNITGLADRLIQNGLITRNQNPQDRRVQYLMLTDKGNEIVNNIRQEIKSDASRILAALNIEDLAALEKGLTALVTAAENEVLSQQKGTEIITK